MEPYFKLLDDHTPFKAIHNKIVQDGSTISLRTFTERFTKWQREKGPPFRKLNRVPRVSHPDEQKAFLLVVSLQNNGKFFTENCKWSYEQFPQLLNAMSYLTFRRHYDKWELANGIVYDKYEDKPFKSDYSDEDLLPLFQFVEGLPGKEPLHVKMQLARSQDKFKFITLTTERLSARYKKHNPNWKLLSEFSNAELLPIFQYVDGLRGRMDTNFLLAKSEERFKSITLGVIKLVDRYKTYLKCKTTRK